MVLQALTPMNVLREIEETVNKLWHHLAPSSRTEFQEVLAPPVDVWETGDKVVVAAAIPGVMPEKFNVTISNNVLTIAGEPPAQESPEEVDYLLRERVVGRFHRSILLPKGLDTDKAECRYENGILTVTIPKLEESRPKRLPITTG